MRRLTRALDTVSVESTKNGRGMYRNVCSVLTVTESLVCPSEAENDDQEKMLHVYSLPENIKLLVVFQMKDKLLPVLPKCNDSCHANVQKLYLYTYGYFTAHKNRQDRITRSVEHL